MSNTIPFAIKRLVILMEPEPGNPNEVEGVLNPGVVRGPDGALYLFPRMVAKGNYSRIGIARVVFGSSGDPAGVERLGIALEPEAPYELRPGGGGCEDPRVTFVQSLNCYVMTYTAFSQHGPRIAMATSEDLMSWKRLGLVTFSPYNHAPFAGLDFNNIDNKDAVLFPSPIELPGGTPAYALIHRPLFPGTDVPEMASRSKRHTDVSRQSMWISYCPVGAVERDINYISHFRTHQRLASPVADWEHLKIGAGAPPLNTDLGWLVLYHGVTEATTHRPGAHPYQYSAGVMLLDTHHPRKILYRSMEPILVPVIPQEMTGAVPTVVFPTGLDRRTDLGLPNRVDVYYGGADSVIAVGTLEIPNTLPTHESLPRDHSSATVGDTT